MAVTILAPVQVGRSTWLLRWQSDVESPIFYVWRDGRLILTTTARSMPVIVADGEFPVFDVCDDPDEAPPPGHPGQVVLQWRAVAGAVQYRVEEKIGSEWTERAVLAADLEGHYPGWRSRFLEDETVHSFRVVAVAAGGNESEAAARNLLMVRHPDPPAVAWSYDPEAGTVTIAAEG